MPWLWRRPAILSMLAHRGLTPVSGLFCHALEVFQIDAARIAARAMAKAKPGAIIIFHDGYNARGSVRGETVEAVRLTVDGLLDRGYRFVTVDQLLGVPAYRPASSAPRPDHSHVPANLPWPGRRVRTPWRRRRRGEVDLRGRGGAGIFARAASIACSPFGAGRVRRAFSRWPGSCRTSRPG